MHKTFNMLRNYISVIRMNCFKRKADRLREITGIQHFIVMMQGKFTIVSKKWFTDQRQHGHFPKTFTAENLKKISFYYTKK